MPGTRPRYGRYNKLTYMLKPSGGWAIAEDCPAVEIIDLAAFTEAIKPIKSTNLEKILLWVSNRGMLAEPCPVIVDFAKYR